MDQGRPSTIWLGSLADSLEDKWSRKRVLLPTGLALCSLRCISYCGCHYGCCQNPALTFQCKLKTSSSPGILQVIITRPGLMSSQMLGCLKSIDSHCWSTFPLSFKSAFEVLVRIVKRNGTDRGEEDRNISKSWKIDTK